jgi:predicted Zn-dependent protease
MQAIRQYQRTMALAPGIPGPELALAELYVQLKFFDRAQPLIEHLRSNTNNLAAVSELDLEISLMEASSWLLRTNRANASSTLYALWQRHPDDINIANRVISSCLLLGDATNAVHIIQAQMSKTPDNVTNLNRQASLLVKYGLAAEALPVLDHILTITNLPGARINRAVARFERGDLAGSESDFHELEKTVDEPARIGYGLALIAINRKDTNQALHYLRVCLSNTPPESILGREATIRMEALEKGSPAPAGDKSKPAPTAK